MEQAPKKDTGTPTSATSAHAPDTPTVSREEYDEILRKLKKIEDTHKFNPTYELKINELEFELSRLRPLEDKIAKLERAYARDVNAKEADIQQVWKENEELRAKTTKQDGELQGFYNGEGRTKKQLREDALAAVAERDKFLEQRNDLSGQVEDLVSRCGLVEAERTEWMSIAASTNAFAEENKKLKAELAGAQKNITVAFEEAIQHEAEVHGVDVPALPVPDQPDLTAATNALFEAAVEASEAVSLPDEEKSAGEIERDRVWQDVFDDDEPTDAPCQPVPTTDACTQTTALPQYVSTGTNTIDDERPPRPTTVDASTSTDPIEDERPLRPTKHAGTQTPRSPQYVSTGTDAIDDQPPPPPTTNGSTQTPAPPVYVSSSTSTEDQSLPAPPAAFWTLLAVFAALMLLTGWFKFGQEHTDLPVWVAYNKIMNLRNERLILDRWEDSYEVSFALERFLGIDKSMLG